MVIVPTFVFDKGGMGHASRGEQQCIKADTAAFKKLSPSQPYLPTDCYRANINNLTASNFHLFEDGVEQKIQAAPLERWNIVVRDNATSWHLEDSDTPASRWSTPDLGGRFNTDLHEYFYNLEYIPPKSQPGRCHRIEVKVDRRGSVVFARNEYCTGQSPSDPLNGTQVSKQMEQDLASGKEGDIGLSLQAGYFYTGAETARVHIALEFPWNHLSHEWNPCDWTLRATIGVLGTAVAKDGSPAARFTDLMYPSYWPTFIIGRTAYLEAVLVKGVYHTDPQSVEMKLSTKDRGWLPTRYETQLDLPPGQYDLRVILSDGTKFGRAEAPLSIDAYDGKQLGLSSVMLCKRLRDAHAAAAEEAAANFAPLYVPLVSKGVRFIPSGDTSFRAHEPLSAYFEIYEPLLAAQPATTVEAHLRILDAKTGAVMRDFPPVNVVAYEQPGSSTVPVTAQILFEELPAGSYRVEAQATDSAGRSTAVRTATFTIE
jgi:hypothetical protein